MITATLETDDGYRLSAKCFRPSASPTATVVIAPAMAVPQSFYALFAEWLASRGMTTWTFDYRGTFESLQGRRRGAPGTLGLWVRQDYDAVVRMAHATQPDVPLFAIGHSFGGQCTPLLPSRHLLSGLVNIGVGSGALRHNTPPIRRTAPLLWHVLVPLLCPLFGYFPGAPLGVIGNLPTGAIREWRRWCLSPDYLLGAEPAARPAYASARYPVLGLALADDELLLEPGARMLHEAYHEAQVDYRVLDPADFDLPRIGHSGFFRKSGEARLWPLVSRWIGETASVTMKHPPTANPHGQAD